MHLLSLSAALQWLSCESSLLAAGCDLPLLGRANIPKAMWRAGVNAPTGGRASLARDYSAIKHLGSTDMQLWITGQVAATGVTKAAESLDG